MSTRKYIRGMLSREARRKKIKPSKWVNREFDRIQIEKYGIYGREINKEKGTHKKSTWRTRVQLAIMKAQDREERKAKAQKKKARKTA